MHTQKHTEWKESYESEREQGATYGRLWREEREGGKM